MASSIAEGTVFLVPGGSLAPSIGVVARRQPRGHVVALYIFADQQRVEDVEPCGGHSPWPRLPDPRDAIWRGKCSDACLRNGEWSVIGVHPDFRREDWPFDRIVHRPHMMDACYLIYLDDKNPLKQVQSERVDCADVLGLPSDALESPYILMEDVLPQLRSE